MKKLIMALLFVLAACDSQQAPRFHGYVEGEFTLIAPTSSGLLKTLSVERGQQVKTGDQLFSLDLTELNASRERAQADVQRLQAKLADLRKGERPEEIEVILKQKQQAQAKLVNARQEYNRVLPLSRKGTLSVAARDNARAELDSAQARLDELDAQLKTAHLGAREDRIMAARASLHSGEYALKQALKKIQDAAPHAPLNARVADTYFRPGEFIAAGQPVVSLLAPENVKVRFYVSQQLVATLKTGQPIKVSCDGCPTSFQATINYIAPQAEYTPPVIYSVESREKLVFLIEAKPVQFIEALRPGLPVDIQLGG